MNIVKCYEGIRRLQKGERQRMWKCVAIYQKITQILRQMYFKNALGLHIQEAAQRNRCTRRHGQRPYILDRRILYHDVQREAYLPALFIINSLSARRRFSSILRRPTSRRPRSNQRARAPMDRPHAPLHQLAAVSASSATGRRQRLQSSHQLQCLVSTPVGIVDRK